MYIIKAQRIWFRFSSPVLIRFLFGLRFEIRCKVVLRLKAWYRQRIDSKPIITICIFRIPWGVLSDASSLKDV